jgi:hypothetical protein
MTQRIKDLYCDLLDIQASGKAQVIFRWYGHANNFEFDVYIPKWKHEKEPDYKADHFFERKNEEEKFAKSEEIVKLLKKLICNEQSNVTVNNGTNIVHEYTYPREGTGILQGTTTPTGRVNLDIKY